ncbi:TonB-dependent receptor [Niabella pedocola]|uniref:TonB-dependent receptor n=1 Tax=Niabella pedocola TaxID=1752077 RepID=A0ABS8PMP0_9BACT|nr:outer membrane beta-barrel protein [Niabella pedocola]MCD2422370.1 TonB-dependent receptor [Niabella pedocola]
MKKIAALLLLSFLNSADAFCQGVIRQLKGRIVDAHKAPVHAAGIRVLNKDGTAVLNASTDRFGYFNFSDSLGLGSILVVSYSGYNDYQLELTGTADKDFGLIELAAASKIRLTDKVLQGRVVNEKKAGLPFANIALKDGNDKSVFQTHTDSLGQFKLPYAVAGRYVLEVSYSGYKDFRSASFALQNKDFGTIALALLPQTLQEVVVKNEAALITVEPNAIVYNVAKSIDAQGVSAFEALKKAPGVYIDNDRTILLNGKAGVIILIDGKQTYLSGAALIDLLKSMPSSGIKSFEMINSPDAKYDASGAAGMINIKTTKSKIRGFNGTLTSGLNYGATLKHVQDLSFNYRKKQVNIFGSYNHFLGYRTYVYDSYRIQEGNLFDSHTDDTDKRMNMGLRLGGDYEINKKNTVGILLNASSIFGGGLTQTKTNIGHGTATAVDQVLNAENDYYYQKTMRYTANVNYKYEDSLGRTVNFDLDYGTFDKGNANRQSNIYSQQNSVVRKNLYRSLNDIDMDLKGFRFDYATNLFKGKFETGAKYANIVSDNDAQFYHQLPTGDSVDDQRTSTFKYTERVTAAYINYKKTLGKWDFQAGVRMENTMSGGVLNYQLNDIEKEEKTPRNYTDFFPSFSVSVKANKNSGVSLAYSRRIDRPAYPDLNPFVYLLDDVSYWQGNPGLLPQMTHRATLQYVYKSATIVGLTYAYTDQYSARVNDGIPGSSVVIFRPLNLGVQKNMALSLTQNKAVNKWWELNFNSTVYQVHNIVAFDQFRNFNLKQMAARMNLQQTFKLSSKLTAEVSGFFNSKRLIGANEIARGNSQVDIGLQQKLMNEKATIRLVATDIYKGNQLRSVQQYEGFYLRNYGYYESRQLRLNFTYRFTNGSMKGPRSRSSSLENENSRAR